LTIATKQPTVRKLSTRVVTTRSKRRLSTHRTMARRTKTTRSAEVEHAHNATVVAADERGVGQRQTQRRAERAVDAYALRSHCYARQCCVTTQVTLRVQSE
jgi:hypothetical protein